VTDRPRWLVVLIWQMCGYVTWEEAFRLAAVSRFKKVMYKSRMGNRLKEKRETTGYLDTTYVNALLSIYTLAPGIRCLIYGFLTYV
jgi:hypothetical protein